jgi:hypothetical protein
MGNHWSDDGDLVIEEKTLFRQVGWLVGGTYYKELPNSNGRQALVPIYEQIATWEEGEGWKD